MNHENEIVNVRIDEIIPNRFQPRLAFDEKELNDLADSIKLHGIIQPLVLRRIGDKYEIIAGERRYKASVLAGLTQVPAVIMNIDDQKSAEVAVVENLQRKDLTAIEEAQSYKKILDMGYLTQEQLATRMGVAQSTIANKLLNIQDNNLQISMLNRIINERLTVRQTDEEINKLLGKTSKDQKQAPVTEVENHQYVDINKEKEASKDIINPYVPKDIDALLKPQSSEETSFKEPTLKEEVSSVKNEPPIKESTEKMINPFQEIETEPEIMDFDITNQTFENPAVSPIKDTEENSIIEEYRQSKEMPLQPEETSSELKSLSKAINSAREEARKIENMGFKVDTEEFDFEDMYQIIIKIQKD